MPDYVEVLRTAFIDLWSTIMLFLPTLIVALVVIIVGVVVANVLKSATVRLVRLLKVDELLERMDGKRLFDRAGIRLDVADVLGWIVKWFVVILALIAAADILQWEQVSLLLLTVVDFIPNVIVAVIIVLFGLIVGNFVQGLIRSAVKVAQVASATFLAALAKWSIIVFSFMAALVQLGIAQSLIQVLFTGFVAMVALAGGLAFGLGGREQAAKVLDTILNDLTSKR